MVLKAWIGYYNGAMGSKRIQELLLASACHACEGRSVAEVEGLLRADLNWASLLQRASAEGIQGLLYHQLKEADLEKALPPLAQQALRKAYAHHLLDYQVKVKALEELLKALDQEQVQVLLLQGMAILERVYSSAGMRPLSDIDLLIRRDDLTKVQRILSHLGYIALSRYPPVFVRDGVCLDLHLELSYLSRVEPDFNPLRIDDVLLWEAVIPWREGFPSALTASPFDQIILSSAHLQKHSFSRLIWFVDIGRLLYQYPSEGQWGPLFERASRLHLEKPLYFVLSYLKEVLRLSILEAALPFMPRPPFNRMERKFHSLLLQNKRIEGIGDFLYLQTLGRPMAQLRFLIQIVFPSKKVMQEITGSSSFFGLLLGYPIRLFHLSCLALRFLVRLLKMKRRIG